MENPVWLPKLKEKFGKAILNFQPLGGGNAQEWPCLWVEQKAAPSVAEALLAQGTGGFKSAVDASIFELDGSLVLTYFLKNERAQIALRYLAKISNADDFVELPSFSSHWPSLLPIESRAGELWGIQFKTSDGKVIATSSTLPKNWIGFPMRKSYVFPTEFQGLPHHRPVGRTVPDEHSLGGEE